MQLLHTHCCGDSVTRTVHAVFVTDFCCCYCTLLCCCHAQPDVDEIEAQRKAAEEALTKAKLKRLAEMQVGATNIYNAYCSTFTVMLSRS
jgi:hypothetical protein